MDSHRRVSRSSCGEQQRSQWWTGRNLRRLIVLAVVPVFGVAAGLVPVTASAAGRTATDTASVMIAGAPARAISLASPFSPAAASSNFWTYETFHRESRISQDDDYDFSAKMTHELEKVTRKALADRITKIGKWLSLLASAINVFVHSHPLAAAIVGFVAAVIAVVNVKKVAALWKWLRGIIYKGRHRRANVSRDGFWARIFTAETIPPESYAGWTARSCPTDAVKCGSPADHNKEYWPKP